MGSGGAPASPVRSFISPTIRQRVAVLAITLEESDSNDGSLRAGPRTTIGEAAHGDRLAGARPRSWPRSRSCTRAGAGVVAVCGASMGTSMPAASRCRRPDAPLCCVGQGRARAARRRAFCASETLSLNALKVTAASERRSLRAMRAFGIVPARAFSWRTSSLVQKLGARLRVRVRAWAGAGRLVLRGMS